MGGSRFSSSSYATYTSTSLTGRSTEQVFTSREMKDDFNPAKIDVRESRDSSANPESTAIIVALDVTGSMGRVLDAMVRGLGTLMTEIYDREPVTDPHVMCMGVGDVKCDRAPLQATQFEADIKIAEQLTDIWLERGGGGNNSESYTIPWYFAALQTEIDCYSKRGKKGYLFTVGDERVPDVLTASEINRFLGTRASSQRDWTKEELLQLVSEKYHVFHLMVEEGGAMNYDRTAVVEGWTNLLGQRAIMLSDHTKLPEVIVSTIMRNEGMDEDEIIAAWSDGSAADAVRRSFNLRNVRR